MPAPHNAQSGNVIFYVLIGVVLIGLVTAAMRMTGMGGGEIDEENLVIRASQVRQNAQELERGVTYIMQSGASEADLRFDHANANAAYNNAGAAQTKLFSAQGGAAEYRRPVAGVNDGSAWEFYGHTSIPGAGSSRPDLIAVLPNVTPEFCAQINRMNGQTSAPGEAGGGCIHDPSQRFNDTTRFSDGSENVLDEATTSFSSVPALQACVDCTPTGPGHAYHFYHVLLAR